MTERIVFGESGELVPQKEAHSNVTRVSMEDLKNPVPNNVLGSPQTPRRISADDFEEDDFNDAGTGYTPFGVVPESIKASELQDNEDWIRASREVYQMQNRAPFEGSDEELSNWGRQNMANFRYNMVGTGLIGKKVLGSSQREKEAFLHMLDTFGNTSMSWGGARNTAQSLATDPTTYAGIGTLGLGFVGKKAASQAAIHGFRQHLVQAVGRTGVVAAADGAIIAGTDAAINENIEVSAGRVEEFRGGRVAGQTAIGAAFGLTFGTGLDLGLGAFRRASPSTTTTTRQEPTIDGETPETLIQAMTTRTPDRLPEITELTPATTSVPPAPQRGPEVPSMMSGRSSRAAVDGLDDFNAGTLDIPRFAEALEKTTNLEELGGIANRLGETLAELPPEVSKKAFVIGAIQSMSKDQGVVAGQAVQRASAKVTEEMGRLIQAKQEATGDALTSLIKQIRDLQPKQELLEGLDAAFRHADGLSLRARQEAPRYNNLTFTKLREEGIAEDKLEATFTERMSELMQTDSARSIRARADEDANALVAQGRYGEAAARRLQMFHELGDVGKLGARERLNFWAAMTELAISNVFSPRTIQVNLAASAAKTFATPFVKYVMNDPFSRAARAELTATYTAMAHSTKSASKAAVASFRMENNFLTGDSNKFLEGNRLQLPGRVGGAIRTIPRLTTATDEFLSRMNYDGYIAGRAASEASDEGKSLGLKGKDLSDHIKSRINEAKDQAYATDAVEASVRPIIEKARNLGLKGEEFNRFVEARAEKYKDILPMGSNEDGKNYVREVLYKRQFSGSGAGYSGLASKGMKGYENTVNRFPILKFGFGQLFIRTPIRVMEEAIRLTPGLQYVAPRFLDDLKGNNGLQKQIRARGESLVSIALTGQIMRDYAEGKLRGDGNASGDWKNARFQNDSTMRDTYTRETDKGNSLVYRYLDPVSTPTKIITNTLERLDQLAVRRAQGEFIDESVFKEAAGAISAGTGAIFASIRDANLFAGIDGTIEAAEILLDPEDNSQEAWKYLSDRLRLLTPNTLHILARERNPEMQAPATFAQMVQTQFFDAYGLSVVKTSKSYDFLGRTRSMNNAGVMWNLFGTTSEEQRIGDASEREQFIDRELHRMGEETALDLQLPYRHPSTRRADLRAIETADGSQTLFDKWNGYYNEMLSVNDYAQLHTVLSTSAPEGTIDQQGARVMMVNNVVNSAREAAWGKVQSEEREVIDRHVKERLKEADKLMGSWDVDRRTNPPLLSK